MLGKLDWAASQSTIRYTEGTGFIRAMVSLGVISTMDSVEAASWSCALEMETLSLGYPRLGILGSNSNNEQGASSNTRQP